MHISSSIDLVTITQVPSAVADCTNLIFNRDPYAHAIHNFIFAVMKQKTKPWQARTISFVEQEAEYCPAKPQNRTSGRQKNK